MKDKIFHFFGNIFEQTPIPTPIKLAIAFRLDLFLFFIAQIKFRVLRTKNEARMSGDFMKYLYKNNASKNLQILENLKRSLDRTSQNLIDDIVNRHEHIFTHNLLDLRLITKQELLDQRIDIYHVKKKYRGFGNYYGIENFYFHCGLYFIPKHILKKYQNKDVLDVGASNGDTPAIFSKEYSFNKIYAFEPEKNNYNQLLMNIKRFHLDNVVPINNGIGDRNIKLKITNESGQSHISPIGKEDVQIITIDEFVEKKNIIVGLIKMDIEGFEYNALQGSLKTIKKYHPILLISIYHNGRDFFEIKPLLEKIGGYTFMVRKLNPHHFFYDTMLIGIPSNS